MESYITDVIDTMYQFINVTNTPFLSNEEIKDSVLLSTNCGINSEILFCLLKDRNIGGDDFQYLKTVQDVDFSLDRVYKIFNIWSCGRSHVAIFYFDKHVSPAGSWLFVESTEKRDRLKFHKHTRETLESFLQYRQKISIWQEICICPMQNNKVNIVINKSNWIQSNTL